MRKVSPPRPPSARSTRDFKPVDEHCLEAGTQFPYLDEPMTLRISQVGPDPAATFKIDGRLMAEEVPELMRVCVGLTGQVVLDLADLQFADRQGVSALRELRAHGVKFTGASPYMELLIGDVPLDAAN